MVKKFLLQFLSILRRIVGFIPALVYGYIYSKYFTTATYKRIADRNSEKPAKTVLDIGTATGHPLHSIIDTFKDAEVIGIDYDKDYIPQCQELFKKNENVTIQLMDFYQMDYAFPEKSFDIIIFGSSFMLMPDQVSAIQIAKKRLSPKGKIYFLLTLYNKKIAFNRFMELIKPWLKYLTTVDFGKVTYKTDFQNFLVEHKLKTTMQQRCSGNFLLKYFKFYIYEAVKVNQ